MTVSLLDRYTPDDLHAALDEATPEEAAVITAALEQERYAWRCDRPDCDGEPHEGLQIPHARAEQIAPPGDWQQISIFLSLADVHINRTPVAGRVVAVGHRPGRYLAAFRAESAQENEQPRQTNAGRD